MKEIEREREREREGETNIWPIRALLVIITFWKKTSFPYIDTHTHTHFKERHSGDVNPFVVYGATCFWCECASLFQMLYILHHVDVCKSISNPNRTFSFLFVPLYLNDHLCLDFLWYD